MKKAYFGGGLKSEDASLIEDFFDIAYKEVPGDLGEVFFDSLASCDSSESFLCEFNRIIGW